MGQASDDQGRPRGRGPLRQREERGHSLGMEEAGHNGGPSGWRAEQRGGHTLKSESGGIDWEGPYTPMCSALMLQEMGHPVNTGISITCESQQEIPLATVSGTSQRELVQRLGGQLEG